MIGQQIVSIFLYIFGLFFFLITFATGAPVPVIIKVFILVGIIFTLFGIIWINYLVSYNQLTPLINHIRADKELIWVHVTKDNLLTFKLAKTGVYGQTKGMMGSKKADVINKGDFPIRFINGNRGIITYEKMSHNINLDHAVAWKKLFEEQKISTGEEAYQKAKEVTDNA